jgi:hypothetical protein
LKKEKGKKAKKIAVQFEFLDQYPSALYSRLQMSVIGKRFLTAEDALERRGNSNDLNVFLCAAPRPLRFIFVSIQLHCAIISN